MSDKEEAATGWEGDDELGSEDLQGRGPSQQHTDTEGGNAVPLGQAPLHPDQPSAEERPGPAAEQQADTDQPPDAAVASPPPAPATMSQSQPEPQEAEHTMDVPAAVTEQHEPGSEAQPCADGDPEAPQRAGSLDRQPDTPPRSPPRSPLPAASAEPPPPEAGDQEDAPEAGAAHQRRPSDDAESTASTSHARDAAAPQEADVNSLPATGMCPVHCTLVIAVLRCERLPAEVGTRPCTFARGPHAILLALHSLLVGMTMMGAHDMERYTWKHCLQ